MLSLDIIEAFNHVLHVRLLHTLKMRRTSSYIIKWACSFLKNRELFLIFNDQTSAMHQVDVGILQSFFISSILFLFFNASLIEKCEALEIKIKVLDFVNDINILIYNKFIEEICIMLNKMHDVCKRWAWTHDFTFASKKYEFTHFIRKLKKFDMMISIHIEESIIKSKSNVRVLRVQLNMKLQWDAHLHQIKTNHVMRMLTFSWLNVFMWDAIFAKAHQVYSTVIKSEMTFEVLTWHQRSKKEKLSSKERRLEILQNQALRHVTDAFKRVNIETLKMKIYMNSLHVHLNKIQNQTTLRSWINDRTQKTKRACELIRAHLININSFFSHFSVIKKTVFLNVSIHQEAEIQ